MQNKKLKHKLKLNMQMRPLNHKHKHSKQQKDQKKWDHMSMVNPNTILPSMRMAWKMHNLKSNQSYIRNSNNKNLLSNPKLKRMLNQKWCKNKLLLNQLKQPNPNNFKNRKLQNLLNQLNLKYSKNKLLLCLHKQLQLKLLILYRLMFFKTILNKQSLTAYRKQLNRLPLIHIM